MLPVRIFPSFVVSRTPHGVRGLKFRVDVRHLVQVEGRTPHGVRGLKCQRQPHSGIGSGRTPHGVRGLKYGLCHRIHRPFAVAPRMGCVD